MADQDQIEELRRLTGESDTENYSDAQFSTFITNAGSVTAAAAAVWAEKMAMYADLVNMSEGGSSRSNSDLFEHAKQMRDHFQSIIDAPVVVPAAFTTTRKIVRA